VARGANAARESQKLCVLGRGACASMLLSACPAVASPAFSSESLAGRSRGLRDITDIEMDPIAVAKGEVQLSASNGESNRDTNNPSSLSTV
jgi:hypothetical protein